MPKNENRKITPEQASCSAPHTGNRGDRRGLCSDPHRTVDSDCGKCCRINYFISSTKNLTEKRKKRWWWMGGIYKFRDLLRDIQIIAMYIPPWDPDSNTPGEFKH